MAFAKIINKYDFTTFGEICMIKKLLESSMNSYKLLLVHQDLYCILQ